MKKWIFKAAAILALLAAILFGAAFWSDADKQIFSGFRRNDSLQTIRADWRGTPIDQRGRFINDEFPFLPKTRDLLKWKLGTNRFAGDKAKDTGRLDVLDPDGFLSSDKDGLIWLGHATFLIRLDGTAIITDPVFGSLPLVDRYVEVRSPLEKIRKIDYVLLSHDHRDHADEASVRSIMERFPNAIILAGIGSEELLNSWASGTGRNNTAGWFQRFETTGPVEIHFVPVRHWARRGIFDTNRRLWGGFVIKGRNTSIYFGGDSGYGRHYQETGELFPLIDVALIGIGAYEPRWFMEPNHNSPADVIKAFRDLGARTLVPMHYGTFDLSDEPPSQPLQFLRSEAEAAGKSNKVRALAINEAIEFDITR